MAYAGSGNQCTIAAGAHPEFQPNDGAINVRVSVVSRWHKGRKALPSRANGHRPLVAIRRRRHWSSDAAIAALSSGREESLAPTRARLKCYEPRAFLGFGFSLP